MQRMVFQLDLDLSAVSGEEAALLGAIMSAISDAVTAVSDAATGAVDRANKKIADLESQLTAAQADAATPEDLNKLQGTRTSLDGLAPESVVVGPNPPGPAAGPTPVP